MIFRLSLVIIEEQMEMVRDNARDITLTKPRDIVGFHGIRFYYNTRAYVWSCGRQEYTTIDIRIDYFGEYPAARVNEIAPKLANEEN